MNSKDPNPKEYYKSYCKLLTMVVKEAKYYKSKKQISTSY